MRFYIRAAWRGVLSGSSRLLNGPPTFDPEIPETLIRAEPLALL